MSELSHPKIQSISTQAITIATDSPEADGTIQWDKTTIVIAHVEAGGLSGLGYAYGSGAACGIIESPIQDLLIGKPALDTGACWEEMVCSVRNIGRPGVALTAISALDVALWDLKGKLVGRHWVDLIGKVRDRIAVYGSGGFTSYNSQQLREQLCGWVGQGIAQVKMKVGSEPDKDPARVAEARAAIGKEIALYVDANGAYTRKQAMRFAEVFSEFNVTWFEEPVSSEDLRGLRLLRDRAPAGMDIAAGEYGSDPVYFRRMLEAGSVDVLQADATRCGGITGFLRAEALCEAFQIDLSAHTAPTLHGPLGLVCPRMRNVEYFHDHVRIERMLFDGFHEPEKGYLIPDLSRPGIGIALKDQEARNLVA